MVVASELAEGEVNPLHSQRQGHPIPLGSGRDFILGFSSQRFPISNTTRLFHFRSNWAPASHFVAVEQRPYLGRKYWDRVLFSSSKKGKNK